MVENNVMIFRTSSIVITPVTESINRITATMFRNDNSLDSSLLALSESPDFKYETALAMG